MKKDWDTVKRQFLTAEQALRNLADDSPALENFQKIYDQAKANYDEHPQNPANKLKKRQQRKKRF